MPDILLYGYVGSESTQRFIREIDQAAGADITVRVNTQGGSPEDMWGMVAKFKEYEGTKNVKIDGRAHSAGALFLAYATYSEGLDVSQYLIHRAAYSEWFEKSEYMTAAMWENLDNMNKSIKDAFAAKIDVKKLEEIKGIKFNDIWSNDTRLDVFLTAKEAKEIGLIDKIVKITPAKRAQIQSHFQGIAAEFIPEAVEEEVITAENQLPDKKMTLDELKSKHPEAYAAAVAHGEAQERDRVGAWMAFVDADAEAVAKGITEGKPLTMTAMAEFNRKLLTKDLQKQVEGDSAAATATAAEATTGAEAVATTGAEAANATALAEFEAEVDKLQKA